MTTKDTLQNIPEVWTFENKEVVENFDAHVQAQLPWYPVLTRFVGDLVLSFLPKNGVLYDIGASTGNITKTLAAELEAKQALTISIEPSGEMVDGWKGHGSLVSAEAEMIDFSWRRPDVAVMFLTLMFMSQSTRQVFLSKLVDALKPGGAIIIIDKGIIGTPVVQNACKAATLADKQRLGTSPKDYVEKELSLRGQQRIVNQNILIAHLENSGLTTEMFFRFGEFYGIIAIKESV